MRKALMLSLSASCGAVGGPFTLADNRAAAVVHPLAVDPSGDRDQVGHVAGDLALEQRVVAQDDVLHLDVGLVVLVHHCDSIRDRTRGDKSCLITRR